jgi:hypothetical protein
MRLPSRPMSGLEPKACFAALTYEARLVSEPRACG